MSAARSNVEHTNKAACRTALAIRPLIWNAGAWRYGRRKFSPHTIRTVIRDGDAVQIGNFIVRSVAELGQPHMIATAPFESMTKGAQELLERAVRSEVVLETFPVEAYEIVIAGYALITGFTIKPTEAGFSTIANRTWRSTSTQQHAYLAALRAGEDAPIRSDGLAALYRNGLLCDDAKKPLGHSLTPFAIRLLDRYWKP